MPNVKIWLLTNLDVSLNATLNEYLWNLSLVVIKATGWHLRGHRRLRVALSEISGLGPKWSFATDTQRMLNIRRRISTKWRVWSLAWPNLIKGFLDVQIIKMHVFGSEENFEYLIQCTCSNVIDEKYRQSVCSAVCYFAVYIPLFFHNCIPFRSRSRTVFYGSGSGSGSE